MDTIMIGELSCPVGWYYNGNLNVYQKVNNKVYVYIERRIGFYALQLYGRGECGMCELEARTQGYNIDKLVTLGEEWLAKYTDGDKQKIRADVYSPHNPDGYWATYIEQPEKVYIS